MRKSPLKHKLPLPQDPARLGLPTIAIGAVVSGARNVGAARRQAGQNGDNDALNLTNWKAGPA